MKSEENNPAAIFTKKQVRRIRYLREKKGYRIIDLVKMFGCSRGAIQGIVEYANWKDV